MASTWRTWVLTVAIEFGVVKLVGYDESAAVPFIAPDVLLLAMLSRRR